MSNVRVLGAIGAVLALAILGAQAEAATRFGAKLSSDTPGTGRNNGCENSGDNCTWIMMEARGAPGRIFAPKNGELRKIRIIACDPGKFTLQLARTKGQKGDVVRNGPSISYQGSGNKCNKVETFTLNPPVPVKKGDQLAVREAQPALLYCSGDGSILQFVPPLKPKNQGFVKATEDEGSCQLLIEAEYND
jgi:hypothetical protein